MIEKPRNTGSAWVDPDDAPEWTDADFERAALLNGGESVEEVVRAVRRGRPLSDEPKQQVTLRLDRAVVARFREDGPGWQSRMNAALRKAAGL
jgi:uncharacterized protein (DUF4415 family)